MKRPFQSLMYRYRWSLAGIAILIAHRRSTIAHVDRLLVLQDGGQTAFGERDSVLAETLRSVAAPQPTTSVPRGAIKRA